MSTRLQFLYCINSHFSINVYKKKTDKPIPIRPYGCNAVYNNIPNVYW